MFLKSCNCKTWWSRIWCSKRLDLKCIICIFDLYEDLQVGVGFWGSDLCIFLLILALIPILSFSVGCWCLLNSQEAIEGTLVLGQLQHIVKKIKRGLQVVVQLGSINCQAPSTVEREPIPHSQAASVAERHCLNCMASNSQPSQALLHRIIWHEEHDAAHNELVVLLAGRTPYQSRPLPHNTWLPDDPAIIKRISSSKSVDEVFETSSEFAVYQYLRQISILMWS